MMRRILIAMSAAALAVAMAVPALAQPPFAGPPADENIVETVLKLSGEPGTFDGNPNDFDILREAVLATEEDFGTATLLSGSDDYTVFAPTDAAFLALAGTNDEQAAFGTVAGLGLETVFSVLAYHVTEGSVPPRAW